MLGFVRLHRQVWYICVAVAMFMMFHLLLVICYSQNVVIKGIKLINKYFYIVHSNSKFYWSHVCKNKVLHTVKLKGGHHSVIHCANYWNLNK